MSVFTSLSKIVNVLTGGNVTETFCCRVFREWLDEDAAQGSFWHRLMRRLDLIWFTVTKEKLHCYDQYLKYRVDTDPDREGVFQIIIKRLGSSNIGE